MNAMQQALMKANLVTEKQIKNAKTRCDKCDSKLVEKNGKMVCDHGPCRSARHHAG